MKKIINDPRDVVLESVQGFGAAHADLVRVNLDPLFVVRRDAPEAGRVAILSGGGSGHEPLHLGFVGPGMLDAAVPGPVFTSPPPDPIIAATRAVDGGAGVLHIVKNYTGDVLNFELAAEFCAAEGIEVAQVVIDDDIAVRDSTWTTGRRGVAGTVLVEKMVGAASAQRRSLAELADLSRRINDRTVTFGLALSAATVPHLGQPSFDLADDEIEIGIGIHGEPGRAKRPIAPATELVEHLLDELIGELVPATDAPLLLMVNGMGGTPLSELYLAFHVATRWAERRGASIARSLVGNFTTALEMQGLSITVLELDDELCELWDAPVHTAAMRRGM